MSWATIAAIATGAGAGGIGIIRLSGPASLSVGLTVAKGVPQAPAARHAYFAEFTDGAGQVLDQGLFLFFPSPHSFTGEDVVELHAHGSPRLLELLLVALLKDGSVRLAAPGEFTRRAFLNGRIDLTRAEAVADLISADSECAVRAAAAQLRGALGERVEALRTPLLELRADLEAALDFPDEAMGAESDAGGRLQQLIGSARRLLSDSERGRLVRRGARVVLFGPVNAGKSTLYNRLLGEARALVDPEPGTTRDVLEARWELRGLALTLIDTAGLRETSARLEAMGIERARAELKSADLALLLLPPGATADEARRWSAEAGEVPVLELGGKADLPGSLAREGLLRVSGESGKGVEALCERIVERLMGGAGEAVLLTSSRHTAALQRAAAHLEGAAAALEVSTLEVVAAEVGLAAEAVGEITGENVSEALLDEIFQRFCIGK